MYGRIVLIIEFEAGDAQCREQASEAHGVVEEQFACGRACLVALDDIQIGLLGDPPDADKRLIAATVEGVRVVCVYVPNGKSVESPNFATKLEWLDRLRATLSARNDSAVVLVGAWFGVRGWFVAWTTIPVRSSSGLHANLVRRTLYVQVAVTMGWWDNSVARPRRRSAGHSARNASSQSYLGVAPLFAAGRRSRSCLSSNR